MKAVIALIFLLFASPAWATTYYVNKSGADSPRGCTNSSGDACLTIDYALGKMSGGDTLIIGNGTYTETIRQSGWPSGSGSTYTTIRAQNNKQVIIRSASANFSLYNADSHHITFDGIVFDGTGNIGNSSVFAISGPAVGNESHHIQLINSEVTNCVNANCIQGGGDSSVIRNSVIHEGDAGGGHCFYWWGSNGLIENNDIYNCGGWGIQVQYAGADNNIIRNNRVHNSTSGGIVLSEWTEAPRPLEPAASYNTVYNNLVYGNGASGNAGIAVGGSGAATTSGNKVYSNTVYNNVYGIRTASHDNNPTAINEIKNNIVYGNGQDWLDSTGNNGTWTTSKNLCGSVGTGCEYGGNPLFIDAVGGNFQLQAGSPALNVGADLGLSYNRDYANIFRPQGSGWDIGAYEREVTTPPPANPLLVLALGFNEGTGTIANDLSGQGNNATLVNATWDAAGRFGKAVRLTGAANSYVRVPHSGSLDLSSNGMTLAAWVKPDSFPNSGFVSVMYKTAGANSYYLFAQSDPYLCNSSYASGGYGVTVDNAACEPTTATTTGQWTHLVVTYDGTNIRFYRNGQIAETRAAAEPLGTNSGDLLIGNSFYGEAFTGLIDEARIYNYALSASEIATMYLQPIQPTVVGQTRYSTGTVKTSAAVIIRKGQ